MSPANWRGPLLIALLAVAALAIAWTARSGQPGTPRPGAGKPQLLLLTSLPLMFGEEFGLEAGGSPALRALQSRYKVVPISVTDKSELTKGRLLLMAHPRAQSPENLVALDGWVREGGRVLLLADPALDWPSERPLGDPLRPPPMFADTGLLTHWGLRLDTPAERGPAMRSLGGYEVMAASPGELFGSCAISKDRLVAHCSLGKGSATVVADADLIGTEHLDGPIDRNLDAVLAELASLERA